MLFLNQLLLWGALAGAIPVILHLVNRRRAKIIDFSSLMFLRLIDMRFIKRRKLKELLLLATRTLLLILLALALAKPVIKTGGTQAGAGAATTACIVLDNSMSMSLEHSGSDSFTLALDAAGRILDTLKNPGDAAALVLSAPAGEPPLPPTRVNIARGKLDAVSVSCQSGDIGDALARAVRFLEDATTPVKELYVLTDLQRASWDFPAQQNLFDGILGSFSACLVDVGAEGIANVAVAELKAAEEVPIRDRPVEIQAVVRNFSSGPASGQATLFVRGTPAGVAPYRLNTGQSQTLTFTFTPSSVGAETCAVEIGGDALALDNRRDFHLGVREAVRVAVVDGDPSEIPYLDECFYLCAALDPLGEAETNGSGIEPKKLSVAALKQTPLTDFDVVILANVADVGAETLERLESFVAEGGGLIWFGGDELRVEGDAGPLLGRIFPHPPVRTWRAPMPTRWTYVNWLSKGSRFLSPFSGEKGFDLATAHYTAYVQFNELEFDPSTRVIAAFANKDPAIIERPYGKGRAVIFASSADLDWNNFAIKPLFLPVLHRCVNELTTGRDASGGIPAGTPRRFAYALEKAPERLSVFRPDGLRTDVPLAREDSGATGVYADTHLPGIYRAVAESETESSETFFSVYPSPDESDTVRIATEQAAEKFDGVELRLLESDTDIAAEVVRLREGIHIWAPLLAAVTMLVVVEGLLANPLRIGRSREEDA